MAAKPLLTAELLRTPNLSDLVAERIEGAIVSGALPTGDRINEAVLAKELGVSRGPIREATRLLAARGLVELAPNRGAFVRWVDRDEMLEIYDLRAVLTGHACALAARSAAPTSPLEALHDKMRDAATAENRDAYYRHNLAFHEALTERANSPRLTGILNDLVRIAHLYRQVSLARHPDMAASNDEHHRILEAIRARDEDAARRHGEAHVRAGKARFDAVREPAPPSI